MKKINSDAGEELEEEYKSDNQYNEGNITDGLSSSLTDSKKLNEESIDNKPNSTKIDASSNINQEKCHNENSFPSIPLNLLPKSNSTASPIKPADFFPSTPSCVICQASSDISFQCSHSFCYKCIYKKLAEYLADFILKLTPVHIHEISNQINMKCLFNECNHIIRAPSKIFLQFTEGYTESYCLNTFGPYFDGMKCNFFICQCKFGVGCCRNYRMNCYCPK